jgi:hypothetical protein
MGDFAVTCAASSLPIGGGCEVYAFLTTTCPYAGYGAPPTEWWARSPAIRAKYNNYGHLEEIEDTPTARAILDVIGELASRDMIPDEGNAYRDKPIRRGISGWDLMGILSVHDLRLQVMGEFDADREEQEEERAAKEERIEADLRDDGEDEGDDMEERPVRWQAAPYLLRRVLPTDLHLDIDAALQGRAVRVRVTADSPPDALTRAGAAARAAGYAAVTVAPLEGEAGWNATERACHADRKDGDVLAELLIFAAPGTYSVHSANGGRVVRIPRARYAATNGWRSYLGICLIRADVWEAAMKISAGWWDEKSTLAAAKNRDWATMQEHREGAMQCAEYHKEAKGAKEAALDSIGLELSLGNTPFPNAHNAHTGIGTHAAHLLIRDDWSRDICDRLTEQRHMLDVMYANRRQPVIAVTFGPQYAEWADHARYTAMLARLAREAKREKERQRREMDAEWRKRKAALDAEEKAAKAAAKAASPAKPKRRKKAA